MHTILNINTSRQNKHNGGFIAVTQHVKELDKRIVSLIRSVIV